MSAIAWSVLALLLIAPAFAQTPDQPAGPPAAASPPPGQLPLGAMRHRQPTRGQVDQRERAQEGADKAEQQQRQQRSEEDQLYDQIMRQSAPPARGTGP